jgi:hypothetical protein
MSPQRLLNIVLASIIALVLSTAYLLDGPTDIEAMQATAASKQDAIQTAQLLRMHELRAKAVYERKSVVLAKATQ